MDILFHVKSSLKYILVKKFSIGNSRLPISNNQTASIISDTRSRSLITMFLWLFKILNTRKHLTYKIKLKIQKLIACFFVVNKIIKFCQSIDFVTEVSADFHKQRGRQFIETLFSKLINIKFIFDFSHFKNLIK